MPLVALLRRIHWERCMAAMCVAAELSVESLNQVQWVWVGQGRRKWAGDACMQAGSWLSGVGLLSRSCGLDKGASPAWLGAHQCTFCHCQVDGSAEALGCVAST